MYVRVDLGQVPPVLELREEDDVSRFHVLVAVPAHAWIHPDTVASLHTRSADPAWQEQLAGMVAFAVSKGWVDDHGRLRAHVELDQP